MVNGGEPTGASPIAPVTQGAPREIGARSIASVAATPVAAKVDGKLHITLDSEGRPTKVSASGDDGLGYVVDTGMSMAGVH
jgi:hypothetical protein